MSIAVGIRTEGKVILAADTQSRRSYLKYDNCMKVHRVEGLCFAGVGQGLGFSIMEEALGSDFPTKEITPHMLTKALEDNFNRRGWYADSPEGEGGSPPCRSQQFLLTDGYSLWRIDVDGAILAIDMHSWEAVGSGAEMAYGALMTMDMMIAETPPEEMARAAILACIARSASCGGSPQVEVVTESKCGKMRLAT